MDYKLLGKSSLEISRISFGCMSLGSDKPENEQLINAAIDAGINFFDTADLYGNGENEVMLGEILKEKRQQVRIATKVGNKWREDGSGWDWVPSRSYILAGVELSLKRLQTDYIDLYQLHGGTLADPIDEIIETFEQLVREGKIRYYGISSIRPNVIREYVKRSNIVSVMMQYSLLDRRPEESCFSLLEEHNIGVLTRGSIAQGLLIDKPAKSYLNYSPDDVAKAAEAVHSISGSDRSSTQTALRYVLQQEAVTSAVVGINSLKRLKEAVDTINTPQLSEEETVSLTSFSTPNFYEQHR